LDTSVRVIHKDGSETVYASLKEASEKTGLSETAIKIRCNKSRQGSCNKKDHITCMWVNDTTFRSYQSKKSRNKGSAWETEVVNKLNSIGYNTCRAAGESKSLDNNKVDIADLDGNLEIAIQCKNTQNLPNYFKLRESCTDPRPFCLLWKKVADVGSVSDGSVAIIPSDFLFELLNKYHNS
jgi:hypothetical protein